jgi:multidrug efflux system membrane fusion protein
VKTLELTTANEGARYAANILPAVRVDLAFKVGGYIQEIAEVEGRDKKGGKRAIQEGDPVKEGQVLARVKATDYVQKRQEVRAMLSEAQAALDATKSEWERARSLFEKQTISKSQFDQARAAFTAAQARVAQAQAGVGQTSSIVADTSMKSPINGTVLKRLIEKGSLVGPGSPGFVVADTRSVKAIFGVPDSLLGTLKIGDPLSVTVEAIEGQTFQGKVSRVAPAADISTRVFEAEVLIPNKDGQLKVGMVASLALSKEKKPVPHVLLPLSAIIRSPTTKDGFAVYVVEEEGEVAVAKLREVTLGEFLGNTIPALKGVAPLENVVVLGAHHVRDGERVTIIP